MFLFAQTLFFINDRISVVNIFLPSLNFVFRKTLFNFVAEICFQSGGPADILRSA